MLQESIAKKPIDFILILRGLLACSVIIFHAQGFIAARIKEQAMGIMPWWIFPSGEMCVWAFFLLSGYLMGKGFHSGRYQLGWESIVKFYKNRAERIFPLYWLVIGFSFLVYGLSLDKAGIAHHWVQMFLDLLTFQYNCFASQASFNAPLWSISTEVQFYCWVPFWFAGLRLALKKVSPFWLLLGILALGSLLRFGIYYQEIKPLYNIAATAPVVGSWAIKLYSAFLPNAYLFLGGMLLNWLLPTVRINRVLLVSMLVACPVAWVLASYLLSLSFVQFNFNCFRAFILFGPLLAFFVVVPFLIVQVYKLAIPSFLNRLFSPVVHCLETLGRWSYGIYLWHHLMVALIVNKWISPTTAIFSGNLQLYWLTVMAVSCLVSIGLAGLTFRFIEQPFERRKHKAMPLEEKPVVVPLVVDTMGDKSSKSFL